MRIVIRVSARLTNDYHEANRLRALTVVEGRQRYDLALPTKDASGEVNRGKTTR